MSVLTSVTSCWRWSPSSVSSSAGYGWAGGSPLLTKRWVRIAPHVVDTALIGHRHRPCCCRCSSTRIHRRGPGWGPAGRTAGLYRTRDAGLAARAFAVGPHRGLFRGAVDVRLYHRRGHDAQRHPWRCSERRANRHMASTPPAIVPEPGANGLTLFSAPHRLFFAAGMVQVLLTILFWTAELAMRPGGTTRAVSSSRPPTFMPG